MDKPYKTPYKIIYNPILKENIFLNKESFDIYQTKIKEGYLPYQSLDMRKQGTVRFAKEDKLVKFLENKQDFEQKMNNIIINRNFDLTSDIDIFKMNRPDENYNFKYLIQLDKNVEYNLKDIVNIIQNYKFDTDFVFVPYFGPEKLKDIEVEKHNTYKKVNIINNQKFVSNLKSLISKEKIGKLIYELNKLFFYANNILKLLSDFSDIVVTEDNIIDVVVNIEKQRIYGVDKKTVAKRLWKRNELLKDYSKIKLEGCNEDQTYKEYFDYLSNLDKIEENEEMINNIRKCNASSLDLKDIVYEEIRDFGYPKNNSDFNKYYNFCKTMSFAPIDIFSGRSYFCECKIFVKDIKNEKVKDILLSYPEKNIPKTRCFNLKEFKNQKFHMFEEYMPEWHDHIYNNRLEEAFQFRQLLLGDLEITSFFRKCSLLFRSDPFISKECDLPGLVHDIELNKTVVSCIANSNMIFPIRIVNGKLVESTRIYETFKKTDDHKLLGSLIIKLKGKRTEDKPRFYIQYIYYNDKERFMLRPVNFRSNVVIPGTFIEYIRLLYLEMNVLMYYKDDIRTGLHPGIGTGLHPGIGTGLHPGIGTGLHPGIGTQLYFYKRDYDNEDNFDILVSKYNMNEIIEKYKNFQSFDNKDKEIYLKKLKEVELIKDEDKMFKFVEKKMVGGKQMNKEKEKDFRFDFKCYKDDSQWNIKTAEEPLIFDREVFSLSLLQKQISLLYEFTKIAGSKAFDPKCTVYSYLKGLTTPGLAKIQGKQIKELWAKERVFKKDVTGKLYLNKLKFIKEGQSVLAYPFESTISFHIYHLLSEYLKPEENLNYVIFAKNHFVLDGLIYYIRYKKYKYSSKNIKFYAYEYENDLFDKAKNFLTTIKVKPISIKKPMNNDWINVNEQKLNNIDYSIIDLVINIDELANIRYAFLLQSYLPPIILTLKNLNKGGTMIVNICLIPNKMVFNFITYLSCFFEETFINEFRETELQETSQILLSFIIFNKFKGISDEEIDKILNLNKLMFQLDSTGGYFFNIDDEKLKRSLNINYEFYSRPEHVVNIIDVNNNKINEEYKKYKEYVRMKFMGSIRNFTNRMNIFKNKDNQQYLNEICESSKAQAIYFAKKYDLPLLDWIKDVPNIYFEKMITDKFENLEFTSVFDLECNDNILLSLNEKIKCKKCDILVKNLAVSESAYQYIEKINYDKYKGVELFINNKYKDLNKDLLNKGININGQYVSRAWIKFYELLKDTKVLDLYKNNEELKVFHICEAPGNFINSMDYFIKKNTNIKKYNWSAQSLAENLTGLSDTYGFIKQTKEKWDMGPTKTGDILDPINQNYYFNKYKGYDMLISDCGEKWGGEEVPNNKNLSIYQLFYALLIPGKGGSFIIKSFSTNSNKLYLSLLYLACLKYEKILVFKSNTNFWSPEVYIIGMNNKGLTNDEERILLECIKKMDQSTKDNVCYPVEKIPGKFIESYDKIMYELISFAATIKKFFVFLATNNEIFFKNKDKIKNIIEEKNDAWMKKYLI